MASPCGTHHAIRSIAVAACVSMLISAGAVSAQPSSEDSLLRADLLHRASGQLDRKSFDSAMATFHLIMAMPTASGSDSATVATFALPAANQLLKQADTDRTFASVSGTIAFAALADSLRPSQAATLIMGAAYFERTQKWEDLALMTNQCGPWLAFREDWEKARRILPDGGNDSPPNPYVPKVPWPREDQKGNFDVLIATRCAGERLFKSPPPPSIFRWLTRADR